MLIDWSDIMGKIITNNPMVLETVSNIPVEFVDGDFVSVLTKVRDYIHKGHKLLTHPLSGSIKPNQTPYKTIMISETVQGLDNESLMIIENAIIKTNDLLKIRKPQWNEKILKDFQLIDYDLIKAAIKG
jgi:hypothetical protein